MSASLSDSSVRLSDEEVEMAATLHSRDYHWLGFSTKEYHLESDEFWATLILSYRSAL